METILKGPGKTVIISPEKPTVLIGERINPTGKKRLAEALAGGKLEIVRREAEAQVAAGADVLDVNVSIPEADEVVLLPRVLGLILETCDVPLCIDTANHTALRAALEKYKKAVPEGKPLINSVNGDETSLRNVLPLVVEFGAAVIVLAMDGKGIPPTAEKRLLAVRMVVERAEAMGISRADLIVDCLALAASADSRAGLVTLETIELVREEFGVNMTFGCSNISFGLPERGVVNQAFLALSLSKGVNCPIVDAAKVRPLILATDLLLGRDNYARRYVGAYRQRAGTPRVP
jgi:5-methyltetrahydrofolate--homocysteine methyltransferase